MAQRALEMVELYNRKWARNGETIQEVRWSLVSGGAYRHLGVSKADVAAATLEGMRNSNCDVQVTFLYDDDAFGRAANYMKVAAERENSHTVPE